MRLCFSLVNVKKDNVIIRQCGAWGVDMEELGQKKEKIWERLSSLKGVGEGTQPEENRG